MIRTFLAAFLALVSLPSLAASPIPVQPTTVCQNAASLSVTTTSANIPLPCSVAIYPALLIINDGAVEAFFAYGSNAVVAAITNIPLPSGSSMTLWIGTATTLAAITASGTTTLRLVQANGGL